MKNMIVMLVIAMSISCLFGAFSKEDAINLVLNDILKDELDFVDVYVKADSMCASDTLYLLNEDPIIPPYSGNWVFFVDDLPRTHWYHSCRYIFISTNDGTKQEISRSIFPNGLSSDFVVISRWERPNLSFELSPLPDPPTPNPVEYPESSHLWAVMIVGNTDLCDYEFWNSASQFYSMLKSWGFTEDQIIVHYLEGMGPDNMRSLDSDNHQISDIDSTAHVSSIAATFADLAATLTPDDMLVVNISGHGQNVDNDTNFSVPDGVVCDYELATWLNDIECSSIITLLNFCHSGGFVDNLADTSSALCNNRTIHTACSINEESSGDRWITMHIDDSNYVSLIDEFPFYWTTAAQGMYPLFIDKGDSLRYFEPVPYLHGAYNTGSFPFECYSYDAWNNAYSNPPNSLPADDESHHESYPDKNPDALGTVDEPWGNNDGILQLKEIFNYANYYDTRSSFGYYNPWRPDSGNPETSYRTSTTPVEFYTQSDMSGYMTLRGIAGNVSDPDLHFFTDFVVGDHLTLLAGSELTIEDNVRVHILKGASIVVQEGALLTIGDNCGFSYDGTDPAIVVRGEVSIGDSLYIVCSSQDPSTGLFLDHSNSASLNHASIKNSTLRSSNSDLSVVNSVFDNSSVDHQGGSLSVSECSFINSCIGAYQTSHPPITDQVTIYGSSFIDYNGSAIKVTGYPNYVIELNTLDNVGTGRDSAILISESGSGGLYSILDNTINDCSHAGVKLYHSYAKIATENQITRCDYGIVALRESSWKAGGNTTSPYQVLSENEDNELYFSYDSAPESFSTTIIDHGDYNTPYVMCVNVPLFHNRIDLTYNCWDGNFAPINDLQPSGLYYYLPYWTPGNKGTVEDSLCQAILVEAIDYIENGNLNSAKNLLEGLVSTYPDNLFSRAALKRLYQIAVMMESDLVGLKSYYQSSPISENTNLSSVADYLATQCDIGLGSYSQAIMWYEDVIMSPPTMIDSLFAQIDLGYLYMSMPDSTRYQCRYPEMRPVSWSAFEQTKSALLAMLMDGDYSNADNPSIPAPSVSNFPNPFNPSTTIRFSIPQDSSVKLVVYNIRGQVVKTIVNDTLPKGSHSAFWNGVDENGRAVSSGVYFYRLQTGNSTLTEKCLLLK